LQSDKPSWSWLFGKLPFYSNPLGSGFTNQKKNVIK